MKLWRNLQQGRLDIIYVFVDWLKVSVNIVHIE